jgi:hypothetical protein
MRQKIILITITILAILGVAFLIGVNLGNIIGNTIARDYYTYTKAICNDDNFCQDYVITCENKEVTSVEPITGAAIQQDDDWEDPRFNKSEIECK